MREQIMIKSNFLPEWAPVRAVVLAWPYPQSDWQANLDQANACYFAMLQTLSEVTEVWVLLHSSIDPNWFSRECDLRGLPQHKLQVRRDIDYNDTWVRDYGPLSLGCSYIALSFNGWGGKYQAVADNQVAERLQNLLGQPVTKHPFVGEGGALETNGKTLLLNADCVVDERRNPSLTRDAVAETLMRLLGVQDIEWLSDVTLTGDDTDGHIDTIVRFAEADALVYAGRNEQHLDAAVLRRLHQQVMDIVARRNWRAFELPSPVICSAIDGRPLPATYANFLIVNQSVLVPVYGVPEDEVALEVLTAAFKSKQIVPVRCEALLEQHGSLHCATMQIASLAHS